MSPFGAMKPRPLRIWLKKAIGFALLLIGSTSGDALTFWKVDELRDEGEACLSGRGEGLPISLEREVDAFGQFVPDFVDLAAGEMIRSVPDGVDNPAIGLGAMNVETLAARESVPEFGLAGEGEGDGLAAPFAPAGHVAGDLLGAPPLVGFRDFCCGGGDFELAEVDHWHASFEGVGMPGGKESEFGGDPEIPAGSANLARRSIGRRRSGDRQSRDPAPAPDRPSSLLR
jgi:hypothetical protein